MSFVDDSHGWAVGVQGTVLAFTGPATPATLTVTEAGSGAGTVTSSPAGISCPGSCSHSYIAGTHVKLSATPAAGSLFAGWSGAGCSGTGTCTVTMSANQSVTATFTVPTQVLGPVPPPLPGCPAPFVAYNQGFNAGFNPGVQRRLYRLVPSGLPIRLQRRVRLSLKEHFGPRLLDALGARASDRGPGERPRV